MKDDCESLALLTRHNFWNANKCLQYVQAYKYTCVRCSECGLTQTGTTRPGKGPPEGETILVCAFPIGQDSEGHRGRNRIAEADLQL